MIHSSPSKLHPARYLQLGASSTAILYTTSNCRPELPIRFINAPNSIIPFFSFFRDRRSSGPLKPQCRRFFLVVYTTGKYLRKLGQRKREQSLLIARDTVPRLAPLYPHLGFPKLYPCEASIPYCIPFTLLFFFFFFVFLLFSPQCSFSQSKKKRKKERSQLGTVVHSATNAAPKFPPPCRWATRDKLPVFVTDDTARPQTSDGAATGHLQLCFRF